MVLKENIQKSQRIESFHILAKQGEDFQKIYKGTVVGYKKIAALNPIRTKELIIEITDSRIAPTLSFIGVY